MSAKNIIIIDEHRLMAGSISRYLRYRFGTTAKISIVADINECEREMNARTLVIVLEYIADDKFNPSHATHIKNTIEGFDPAINVIVLTAHTDIRTDIVTAIKEMERRISKHILKHTNKPLTIIGHRFNSTFIYPIKVLIKEHSIGAFVGMYVLIFGAIGIMVIIAGLTLRH